MQSGLRKICGMEIGILQTGDARDALKNTLGDYDQLFVNFLSGQGFNFETFRVLDNVFPDSVTAKDGWIVTGSRHGAYEDHAFIPPLEQFIRDSMAANIPMAGFCFGHQIMAQALGGKVVKFPDGWATGNTEYDVDPTVDGGEDKIRIIGWHQDQVIEAPEGAKTIMRSEFCEYAGLAYGDNGFSTQPHPEFSNQYAAGLLDELQELYSDDHIQTTRDSFQNDLDTHRMTAMVAAFFKKAHSRRVD